MSWRARVQLAVFLVAVGARGAEPEPQQAPALARSVTLPFRVLIESTPELSDVPRVTVAENDDELSNAWSDYRLPGEPPAVDFRERFVMFTAYGLGELHAFVLTSAGELLSKSPWRSPVYRTLELYDPDACPRLGVRAVSFPRSYFPKGRYTFGLHPGAPTFTVRGGARSPPPLEPLLPIPAPPESVELAKPAHSRRARIILKNADQAIGVWVRDDIAWTPEHRADDEMPPSMQAKLVCDGQTCARVLVRVRCYKPECPDQGSLLVLDRKLGAHGPWPRERVAWERLMIELASDPELERLLPGAPIFPELPRVPTPPPERRLGMARSDSRAFYPEIAAAAEGALLPRAETWLAGPSLRLALRKTHPVQDTTWGGHIGEAVAGDGWGLDLRFKLLRELDTERSRTFLSAGAAIAAENAIGRSTTDGRLRVPSVIGLVLPEVGAAAFLEEPVRLYTSHGLPFYFLLTQAFALEMRPAFTLVYGAAPNGDPEALFSLSLGLMGRILTKRCP
jgi:hypothetical protein